jgi:hypothetical protein
MRTGYKSHFAIFYMVQNRAGDGSVFSFPPGAGVEAGTS